MFWITVVLATTTFPGCPNAASKIFVRCHRGLNTQTNQEMNWVRSRESDCQPQETKCNDTRVSHNKSQAKGTTSHDGMITVNTERPYGAPGDLCVWTPLLWLWVLLSHKKEWSNTIFSNMGGPRDYHLSHAEKDKYLTITFMCGILKNIYKLTQLQNRVRHTDIESKFEIIKGKSGVER